MEISCIIVDDELHALAELSELMDKIPGIYVAGLFDSLQTAVDFLDTGQHINIVFSDIDMPVLNGISGAKILQGFCDFLVFVTAHRHFALEAFEVRAAGYLLKPVGLDALISLLANLREKLGRQTGADAEHILFIKGGHKNAFIKLEYQKIIYIEAALNYIKIHTTSGEEITYIALKELEQRLKMNKLFLRISRSVVVGVEYIDRVEGNSVQMKNKIFLTIGDKYRNAFHEFMRKRTLNYRSS